MSIFFFRVGRDVEVCASDEHQQASGINNAIYSSSLEIDGNSFLPKETKCK